MKRVVFVWLPDWPITIWQRSHPVGASTRPETGPFALVTHGPHGLTLSALNDAARAAGLRYHQSHADACAILPDLASAPAEPERDLDALHRLALWAERFSPCVAIDTLMPGHEGLFLDMTGAAHLFGGETALLAEICRCFVAAAIPARLALADTPGAAWALARFAGRDRTIAPAGDTRAALAALPVAGLRLEPPALALLRRFGLNRIGDLYAMPRAGLARRFQGEAGLCVVERLDQALGIAAEPLIAARPAPIYRAWMGFAEPVIDMDGVAQRLPELAHALAGQLERDAAGIRRLALVGFRADGRVTEFEVGFSAPTATPAHMLRLLQEKGLEWLDLGFGIDALMLSALQTEPLRPRQGEMQDHGEAVSSAALAGLIDRLQARLGEGVVRRPVPRESWLPERSEIWVRADPRAPQMPLPGDERLRPILLFDPPEPVRDVIGLPDERPARFVWRRVARRVAKAEGPERLGPEWWRDPSGQVRDYYRVEDEEGHRYWLYREGTYGAVDTERAVRWWLHGVFA
jgi:protein ImuB